MERFWVHIILFSQATYFAVSLTLLILISSTLICIFDMPGDFQPLIPVFRSKMEKKHISANNKERFNIRFIEKLLLIGCNLFYHLSTFNIGKKSLKKHPVDVLSIWQKSVMMQLGAIWWHNFCHLTQLDSTKLFIMTS